MTVRDIMTEEEAKKKWCPLARIVTRIDEDLVVANRVAGEIPFCVGSHCMFWRWSHQDNDGMPTGFCGGATLPKYM